MKSRLFHIILFSFLIVSLASAQVDFTRFAGRGKVGTTGFQFLKIGTAARAVAMGESFASLANDASAMYYNPAGLVQLEERETAFSLTTWPADISYGYIGSVMPTVRFGTFGAFVGALTTGDMKKTVPYKGWTGEYFSATDWLMGLSYGRGLTDRFSVGGNVKMVSEFLDTESVTTWAVDFGTMFDIGVRGIKFSMFLNNFGPNVKFIKEQFSLPTSFKIGLVMDAFNFGANKMILTFEGSHPNDNVEQVAVGTEYTFKDLFALRAGYRGFLFVEEKDKSVQIDAVNTLPVEEPMQGLSLGFGLNVPVGGLKAKFDYAYVDMGFLENAQRLTFTVNY
jgi:hypothetical protein